jgi:hypothetical protein
MKKLFQEMFLISCLFFPLAGFAGVPQIFLVQNSGWMQPYFSDPAAQFPEILQRLADMSCSDSKTTAVLATFNQAQNPDKSPQTLYQGNCKSMPMLRLAASIKAAHLLGNHSVFANSDYQQAIYRGIERYANGHSALFWMITNNKNSPNNSQQLNAHDSAFYRLLHDSAQISRVVALPLPVSASSHYFTSHGIILFGIAYGHKAATKLADLVSSGAIQRNFGVQAALLKPLTVSAVQFVPQRVTGAATGVSFRQGALVIDLPAKSHAQTFTLEGRFRNEFYPYTIERAKTQAILSLAGKTYQVPLTPRNIRSLEPGKASRLVTLTFTVPPTPNWSLQTVFGSGRDINANLRFFLTQQTLAISPQFVQAMDKILPNTPMPAIFRPDAEIHSSQTSIPMLIHVTYPIWPLLVLLLGLLAILALLSYGIFRLANIGYKPVQVRVNGKVATYRLARGKMQALKTEDGVLVAELRRGMFGYRVNRLKKGVKVELVK